MRYRVTRGLKTLPERLGAMGAMARRWARDPLSLLCARLWCSNVERTAPLAANAIACAEALRREIRYQTEWPETYVGLGPLLTLGAGDCDDVAIALASVLLRQGFQVRWAVGWEEERPTHVWVQVRVDGRWLDLDASTPFLPLCASPVGHPLSPTITRSSIHSLEGARRA